jgi:hypothetical protein
MQRALIAIGLAVVLVGLAWPRLGRLGLGRLPGDIDVRGERGAFYFPLATCVLLSAALSLVLWLIHR